MTDARPIDVLRLFFVSLSMSCCLQEIRGQNDPCDNVTLLTLVENILGSDRYDKKIRPDADLGLPTTVAVNIFVNSVSSVNEVDMEYSINMYLRQEWDDRRLAHPSINRTVTLHHEQYADLWVPDLFFPYEKESVLHAITVPNRLLMLSQGGHILYSQRVSLKLSCNMLMKKYPLDNQTCYMQIESYGYTDSELIIRWRDKDAFNSNRNLELPEFRLTELGPLNCSQEYPVTGHFSCIKAVIKMERYFNYYLIQTYVPSMLIVILSWVSFWIDKDAVPARITLGLLTVLTMTTQASGINQQLPRVSYVKAIDIWMSTCLLFVFGALVEYSIVNVLARKDKSPRAGVNNAEVKGRRDSRMDVYAVSVEKDTGPGTSTSGVGLTSPSKARHRNSETGSSIADEVVSVTVNIEDQSSIQGVASSVRRKSGSTHGLPTHCLLCCRLQISGLMAEGGADCADILSRALFPVSFIIFNLFYWTLYVYVL